MPKIPQIEENNNKKKMSKSIFLSHSHKDREKYVNKISNFLSQAGIKVWDSEAELNTGDSLIDKIQNGIQSFDYLGVILTKNSCKSEWVLKEVFSALNEEVSGKKCKVLPILVENCDIPYFLKDKIYADLRGEKFSEGLRKITEQLFQDEKNNYLSKFYPYISSHPKGKEIISKISDIANSSEFPKKMIVNGEILDNPIYDYLTVTEQNKIKKDYGKNSSKIFRFIPLDLHFIKARNLTNENLLLCYYSGTELSGWKTWLFPHRGTDKNIQTRKRFLEHADDLESLLRLNFNSAKLNYTHNNDYILSFKPDFGYGGFVLYLFCLCNVKIVNPPQHILSKKFEIQKGTFSRKFNWFYTEELMNTDGILNKNSDLIRAIHTLYESSLTKIPNSFMEPIK